MMTKTSNDVLPVRCPKCRSVNIYLREFILCASTWYPGDTKGYHETGSYNRVEGNCLSCGHVWKLRGHIQVWDELRERLEVNAKILGDFHG